MLLHLLPADGTKSAPDACIEQSQVFVDFSTCPHGGARISGNDLLLDGNGWRDATDVVALRLSHTAKELTGVSVQTLHIATLPLSI